MDSSVDAFVADRVNRNTIVLKGIPINISKLARVLNLSPSLMSRVFNGSLTGSVDTVEKLALTLGMGIEETRTAIKETSTDLRQKRRERLAGLLKKPA